MASVYDKLGALLSDALNNGEIPQAKVPVEKVDEETGKILRIPAGVAAAYKTLDLAPGDNIKQVKHAYRLALKKAHPDKNGSAARTEIIIAAYSRITEWLKEV